MPKQQRSRPARLRGPLSRLVLLAGGLLAAALLVETIYRLQLVETYASELRSYNDPADLASAAGRETLLVLGDSFSAGNHSYPSMLRRARPDLRVINGAIPATGIVQANIVAGKRFRRFRPSILVYQITVGNDLLNLRYPIHWGRLSPLRNAYWTVAHRLRSVEFANYRAAQMRAARRYRSMRRRVESEDHPVEPTPEIPCLHDDGPFDPARYERRERLYVRADPGLYESQILVDRSRRDEFERLIDGLLELLSHCEPTDCEAFVLVVPHASQISRRYIEELRELGAHFGDPSALQDERYPFLEGIRRALAAGGRSDVRVLSPLRALREREAAGEPVYYRYDPHLNRCGQETLAAFLLQQLDGRAGALSGDGG